MKLVLREKDIVPPGGGYYLVDPDTNRTIFKTNLRSCVDEWRAHRLANNLPIPIDIQGAAEDLICQQLAKKGFGDKCARSDGSYLPHTTRLRVVFDDLARGTLTIMQHVLSGRQTVDQPEADRRAAICVTCDFNVEPQDCGGCKSKLIAEVVKQVVGGAKTPFDDRLKSCYWCGCFNAAQVHVKLDYLQRHLPEDLNESLPNHCWKKRSLTN
jgi:hypothetical protein